MKRWIAAVLTAAGTLVAGGHAYAQDATRGPATVVVTIIPGGATFFTEGKDSSGPSFGNYDLGAGVAYNINRFLGVEGEFSGSLGVTQDLQFATGTANRKTPNLVNYSANVVLSAPSHSSVTPYVTGGVGGLTVLETTGLGITEAETFLTGNVGGGVKWQVGRFGLRGDYRFLAVRSKDDAPAFFGQE